MYYLSKIKVDEHHKSNPKKLLCELLKLKFEENVVKFYSNKLLMLLQIFKSPLILFILKTLTPLPISFFINIHVLLTLHQLSFSLIKNFKYT